MQNKSRKPRVQDMKRLSIILKLLLHRILISAVSCALQTKPINYIVTYHEVKLNHCRQRELDSREQ